MDFHYSDTQPASPDSPMYLTDAKRLWTAGQKVLANFGRRGTEGESSRDTDFNEFIEMLYTSGMVMTDFDAPLFDRGPGRLIADSTAIAAVSRFNLLTVRMFLHTLARGHRVSYAGFGYPYFAEAYKSGGLHALLDRLAWFCDTATVTEAETLDDGWVVENEE